MSLKSNDEIEKFLESYERDSKALKTEVLRMCWGMRGGLTYTEGMHLSSQERSMVTDLIKENMDVTKKTKMPFF